MVSSQVNVIMYKRDPPKRPCFPVLVGRAKGAFIGTAQWEFSRENGELDLPPDYDCVLATVSLAK